MSNSKPQKALQLGLNVLIDKGCEGHYCNFHKFPYEFKSIVTDDKRKTITFNSINDVWDYIALLCQESKEHHKKGSQFTDLNNIYEQLPFFVCPNHIVDEKDQKDISRYIYSKDTNTPPYRGSYGDTPSVWVQKYYIIKQALSLRESKLKQKAEDGNK